MARTRVRDWGLEGPSHARGAYEDRDHSRLGCEAQQLRFQRERVCPGAQRASRCGCPGLPGAAATLISDQRASAGSPPVTGGLLTSVVVVALQAVLKVYL